MEKNIDEAIKWLKMAAEHGNQEAMLKLGNIMYQIEGNFAELLEKSHYDGYNEGYDDAKAGKRNKYIKEEPKIVAKPALNFGNVKVGSIIKFGSYLQSNNKKEPIEWYVLAKEDGKALIVSQYAIDCEKYDDNYESTSWGKCTLRKWLNSYFLNSAFNRTEQKLIQLSMVTADKNPWYNTNQGSNTEDKIFLLSVNEVRKYFKNSEERKCQPTNYTVRKGVKRDFANCWWWLRSMGNNGVNASSVDAEGSVYYSGYGVYNVEGAVRPALWINLNI